MPTSEAQLASYSMGMGAPSMTVEQLACEAHHSPPSSARMYGGIPPLPHMPSWYCTNRNLLLWAAAVVVIMSNGLENSPPLCIHLIGG